MRRGGVKPTVAEQRLLELLFADEELRHSILPRLEPEDYEGLPTAAIFQRLAGSGEQRAQHVDFDIVAAKRLKAIRSRRNCCRCC